MTSVSTFAPFELTAADYVLPMVYAGSAIYLRPKVPEQGVPVLQDAIKALTKQIPFLTGVVAPVSGTHGGMQIRPATNDQSSLHAPLCAVKRFPHLRLPSSSSGVDHLDSLTDFNYDRNAGLVLAPIDIAALRTNHPVIRFQINVLADGVILNLFHNHAVLDGAGLGVLVETLATYCRSGPNSDYTVDMDREMATRAFLATVGRETIKSYQVPPAADTAPVITEEPIHDVNLHDCIFSFSAVKVDHLHQAALQQWQQKTQSSLPSVSADDIVAAVLSLCFTRLRSQSAPAQPASCTIQRMVDVRRRFDPPIPSRYMGNCYIIIDQPLSLPLLGSYDSIEEATSLVGEIACELRSNLNKVDHQYVRNVMAQHSQYSNTIAVSEEPDIWVTSLRRLPIYQQQFGPILGEVVKFQLLPYMNPERVFTISPCRVGDETWEVCMTLNKTEMDLIMGDRFFRWIVKGGEYLRFFENA